MKWRKRRYFEILAPRSSLRQRVAYSLVIVRLILVPVIFLAVYYLFEMGWIVDRIVNIDAPATQMAEQASIPPRFHEEEVARRLWQDVRRQLDARRAPGFLKDRSGKPRLAFLSPYPLDRSGVADYTAATKMVRVLHCGLYVAHD